jgi:hypothetical protein
MKAKKSAKHGKLQFYLDMAIIMVILLIIAMLVSLPNQPTKKTLAIEKINSVVNSIAGNNMYVFPISTPSAGIFSPTLPPPTPTPTPNLRFRHSKWFFSFDMPVEATAYETVPEEPKLVENSIGGAYVEIPDKLYAEFAIVQPFGQNLDQYYHNRMSMIFNEKILEEKTATFSGTLKGYETRLENAETKEKKIILYLSFRGNQFFEIEADFPQKKHDKEEKMFFKMVETLKNY